MLHKVLELIGTAPCVDAEWRGRLGTAYCALSRFLVAAPDLPLSDTYYCAHCGGTLSLQPASRGSFTAIPLDEYATCPIVEDVKDDERVLKVLNVLACYRSFLDGLGVDEAFRPLEGWNSAWRLGSVCVRGLRYPVYAALFHVFDYYLSFLCSLPPDKPYIFLGGSYSHECETLLAARGSCFLSLQDDFELADGIGLRPLYSASAKVESFKSSCGKTVCLADIDSLDLKIDSLQRERIEDLLKTRTQRQVIEEMAEGPEKFIAGLRAKLSGKEADLFTLLIHKESGEFGSIRVLSYTEIGERLKPPVTKQAVGAQYKKMEENHPVVWAFVESIRKPEKETVFSGLSPSERRKEGVDEAYNYNAR